MNLFGKRFQRALLALALLLLAGNARAGVNRWTTNGPTAPFARRIAIDPADPTHLLAPAGILFESRDAGASWHQAGGLNVTTWTVAFDPLNPAIVYSGGTSGISKSFDNGMTWTLVNTRVNAFFSGGDIEVDPDVPSTLYAATEQGPYVSKDSGCSWTELVNGLPFVPPANFFTHSITIDPMNPEVLYLSSFSSGAFRSADGGASWSAIHSGMVENTVERIAVDPSNPSRIYAVTDQFDSFLGTSTGGLYRSLDAGTTWTRAIPGSSVRFEDVAVDPISPTTVYAASAQDGVLKSTDAGDTWAPMNQGLGMFPFAVAVSPVASGTVYVSTSEGPFVTHDGGIHWSVGVAGMIAYYARALAIDPSHPATIYSVGLGGIDGVYQSTNGSVTWTNLGNGIPPASQSTAVEIDPTAPTHVWVSTESPAGAFFSTNAGVSWTERDAGIHEVDMGPFAIDPLDSDRILAGSAQGVYRSLDGGITWTQVGGPQNIVRVLFLDNSDSNVAFAVFGGQAVKSNDFGDTWNPISDLPNSLVLSMTQSPSSSARFVAGTFGGVFESSDGGDHWTPNASLPPSRVQAVRFDPTDDATLYAGTTGFAVGGVVTFPPHGILVSHDSGGTWSAINRGLTNVAGTLLDVSDIAVDPSGSILYAGTSQGVFRYDISPTPIPTIAATAPASGSRAGGDVIVVSGTGFASGATVLFGSSAATGVSVSDPTSIQATTPPGAPGSVVDVTVTNPDSQFDVYRSGFVYDFLDVPPASPYQPFVAAIARDGITAGCGGGDFCPDASVTRGQAAVFLEIALHGPGFGSLERTGTFDDFDTCGPLARYIFGLVADGITAGCGPNEFCPGQLLTRAQMAVFILRAKHGGSYSPPPCTGVFSDVPCGGATPGFAVDWIEELFHEGITAGCDAATNSYCPAAPVTRAQMAVFLVRALGL